MQEYNSVLLTLKGPHQGTLLVSFILQSTHLLWIIIEDPNAWQLGSNAAGLFKQGPTVFIRSHFVFICYSDAPDRG